MIIIPKYLVVLGICNQLYFWDNASWNTVSQIRDFDKAQIRLNPIFQQTYS